MLQSMGLQRAGHNLATQQQDSCAHTSFKEEQTVLVYNRCSINGNYFFNKYQLSTSFVLNPTPALEIQKYTTHISLLLRHCLSGTQTVNNSEKLLDYSCLTMQSINFKKV